MCFFIKGNSYMLFFERVILVCFFSKGIFCMIFYFFYQGQFLYGLSKGNSCMLFCMGVARALNFFFFFYQRQFLYAFNFF